MRQLGECFCGMSVAALRAVLLLAVLPPAPVAQAEGQPKAPTPEDVKSTDLSSRFHVDEADPEKSIPAPEEALKNPLEMGYLMMDLIARAEAATQRGDHAATVRYYKAVAKAVPNRSVSFSKLCKAYKELGDLEQAIDACRQALGKGGVQIDDYALFVSLVLQRERKLEPAEIEDLDAVVDHLKEQLPEDAEPALLPLQLQCEIATKLEDDTRLRACVDELIAAAPQDPRTFTYRYALAMQARDFDEAEAVIADAKTARLPANAVVAMEDRLRAARERGAIAWARGFGATEWVFVLGLCAALGLLLYFVLRRPKLHTA